MIGLVISGIDRTSYIDLAQGKGGQSSYTAATAQRGSCSVALRVHPGDTYAPAVGNPISLYDQTGIRVFGGLITEIKKENEGNTQEVIYTCTGASFERMLDKRRIQPASFFNQTAGYIFTALFNSLPGETILLGTIEAGPTIASKVFRHELVTSAFNDLATEAGFVWGVDPNTEKIYFHSPTSVPAPFTITGNPATGAGILYDTIEWDTAQQDFRSRQFITVDFSAVAADIELVTGDGTITTFTLSQLVDTVTAVSILGGPANSMGTAGGVSFTAGKTITVGTITYTLEATLGVTAYQVLIGADDTATMTNLAEAINGGPNMGTDFTPGTLPNPQCTAVATNNTITVTAIVSGTTGNSIPTTTTCSSGMFSWPSPTLSNGSDGPTRAESDATVGTPANGDTVTIDNVTYTYVTALDNTQPYQVKVASDASSNLCAAIAGAPGGGAGVNFSLPTTPHPTCAASYVSASSFKCIAKIPGTAGNSIAVSKVSAAFTWNSATLTGGIPGPTIPQTVSLAGSGASTDWQYTEGSAQITAPVTLAPGQIAMVTYYRLGVDIIGVQDDNLISQRASVEGSSGIYEALIDVSSQTDPVATDKHAAVANANSMLKNYGLLTQTLTFSSDSAGWAPGQAVTVNVPPPFDTTLNGTWLIAQIQGSYIPGMPGWRVQVQAIAMSFSGLTRNAPTALARRNTWQMVWQRMATVNPRRQKPAARAAAVTPASSGAGGAPSALGMVTFGLDDDTVGTNSVGKYGNVQFAGKPFIGSISCVTPPTTANAQFDVLFSHDNGTTWTSLFLSSNPLVYPTTGKGLVQFAVFANVTLSVGDILRVDTVQSGGAKGITGVIRWQ